MNRIITVEQLVNNLDDYIIIDLRAPGEYSDGKIMSAINIPLLDDETRAFIGTLYKQDQAKAYDEGYKIGYQVLPKIEDIIKGYNQKICFYCARGGTRSTAVFEALLEKGYDVYKLEGGYKSYRNYILMEMDNYINQIDLLVLTGNTGSGKTIVLNNMLSQGYPVIDLEGLANHRGSLFGAVGLGDQPSQKDFEDKLFYNLKEYIDNNNFKIMVESESRKIGNVYLPNKLNDKLKTAEHILLEVSVDKRADIIIDTYQPINKDDIVHILDNYCFVKRLGYEWINNMKEYLDNDDYHSLVVHLLVDYYDKLYANSHKEYNYKQVIESDDLNEITKILINTFFI